MKIPAHLKTMGIVLTTAGLVACGGSGGAPGSGGSSVAAVGQITGFGSVFVNGIEFDTSGTSFDVDDRPGTQDDLEIGMVVRVYGSRNDDGVTGRADRIVYDDDLEGPIEAITTSYKGDPNLTLITVLGKEVLVSRSKTRFDKDNPDYTFDTMALNDVVEVSGYFDGNGVLHATHLEKSGVHDSTRPEDTHAEIKGVVSGLAAGQFMLGTITVSYDANTDMSDLAKHGKTLEDGLQVEVEGRMTGADSIYATKIDVEDSLAEDGEASVEGIVSNFTGVGDFMVNGVRVDATNAKFEPAALSGTLANDMWVEVEGPIVDGVLQAREVEAEDGDEESGPSGV